MKLKQIVALISVLVVGLLIAFGISLLNTEVYSTDWQEADESLRAMVEAGYGLEPGIQGIYLREQEGDFYILEIYTDRIEGGGGGWSIGRRVDDRIIEVDSGQTCAPLCDRLTEHQVPMSLVPYCQYTEADPYEVVIDRETGNSITDETFRNCI